MPRLKPHQQDLLARIVRSGGLPAHEVDGRLLRPLRSARLVEVVGQRVVPTRAGRHRVPSRVAPAPGGARLNGGQEDLLRTVLRSGEVPMDQVDGRVARPLIARGLVSLSGADVLQATEAGLGYFQAPPASPRRRRKRVAEHARAEAIRQAVRKLEVAVPRGSEVLVGSILAAADDLVDAFLSYARNLEQTP